MMYDELRDIIKISVCEEILAGWRFRVGRINDDILSEVSGISVAWNNDDNVRFTLSIRRGDWKKVSAVLEMPDPENFVDAGMVTDDYDVEVIYRGHALADTILSDMMSEIFPDAFVPKDDKDDD